MKIDVNKLDRLRESKGWTITQLSIQVGVSEQTIRNIRKNGSCSDKIAENIARAFDVNAGDLEPKEAPDPELPEAITQTLEAVKDYGQHEYQRGKDEMCTIFLKAVREAIERWKEANGEV